MFTLENVSKKFGTEYALRDISMTIGNGLNFIIGASGSGKTTLLKILSGMEHDFIGDVRYCDKSIKNLSEKELSYYYHNVFGFVWQDFNLLDDRTVLENVMLPQYLSAAPDKKAAMKLLGDVDISELAFQKVGKLSGGQKQRVAIARELAKNPQVLLADEPTSALDEKSAKAIMRILRSISKSRTVIIVTHDTSLIEHSASVYELDKGALIAAADGSSCPKPVCAPRPHRL
ncbi:MAG: ABC transporter ATP-binding protein, partial [Clostridia bacterium]